MTKVINIDALREEAPFVLVIGDVKHEMQVTSVADFIENMKMIETLGVSPSLVQEIEVGVKVILRAFPTLTDAEVRSWQLPTIQKLFEIARGGEVAADLPDTSAPGNAQPAS